MKKQLLLLALLSATATVAQAQSAIPAGTISLGGSIGYNRDSDTDDYGTGTSTSSSSTFQFTPSVGYFVADNLAIGLNLGFATSGSEHTTSSGATISPPNPSALRVGPYAQYYKMLSDQFGLVGTLGLGYVHTSDYSSSSTSAVEVKGNGFYAGLTPSIVFFPIPKFGISASIGALGYQRRSLSVDGMSSDESHHSSSFGAGFGFDQLQFGGTYYFGR